MNPIVRTIYRSNVWAFPIFAIILCGANWLLATGSITMKEILFISVLFAVYYNLVFYSALYAIGSKRKKWIVAFCVLMVIILTMEPILELLIYSYFPIFDVYLDQNMLTKNYIYDRIEFRRRWVSALTFIIFLVGLRIAFRLYKNKRLEARESRQQVEGLKKTVKQLHDRLKSRELNTHFIENFVIIALHREKKPYKENVEMLTMLTDLMNYQLSMDNEQQTTNWQEEWEQMQNLLQMAHYKDPKFVCEWSDDDRLADMDMVLPHGLLLMPLENAIKYGKNTAAWPLRMEFSVKDNRIYIRYMNYFDPVRRSRIKSTGKGFRLMETRLAGGEWPITLRKWEENDLFYVDIEIAC